MAFSVFGLGGLALGAALGGLRLAVRDAERGDALAQHAIHRVCRAYLVLLRAIRQTRVRTFGAARLHAGPCIVVANHPTLLDVVVLLAEMPRVDCIVNASRARNVFLRGAAAAAGYVPNDGGREVVERCAERLRAGRSVLVFPEGTRSPESGMHRFQRGAAHLALESGCDLLPVSIRCEPLSLRKGQRWYDVPGRAMEFTVRVGEAISPRSYGESGESRMISARKLTGELRETIAKGLSLD